VRITKCEPFREVSREVYDEGLTAPLHFEHLKEKSIFVARFLVEKGQRGADFYVRIGKIALKPKKRIWKPETVWGYPSVTMKWEPHGVFDLKSVQETRPVSWEGQILGKRVNDGAIGYFVPEHPGGIVPDECDIAIARILIEDMAKN
jgi:hypothetical protein